MSQVHAKFRVKFGDLRGEAVRLESPRENKRGSPRSWGGRRNPRSCSGRVALRTPYPRLAVTLPSPGPPPRSSVRAGERLPAPAPSPAVLAEVSLKAAELLGLVFSRAFITPVIKAGNRLHGRAPSAKGPGFQHFQLRHKLLRVGGGRERELPKARF